MQDSLKVELATILEGQICGSLSTLDTDNKVYCNTIYYCFDKGFNLYFASDFTTTHAVNIANNPNVAICIWNPPSSYGGAHIGLQITGECHIVTGAELLHAWSSYISRFNVFQQKIGSFENLRDKLVSIRLYKVIPKTIKITDTNVFGKQAILVE